MRPFQFPPTMSSASLELTEAEGQQMTAFLQKLVQTPSHSGHEAQLATLIISELASVGITNVSMDSAGSLIAYLGDGNGRTLLIDSHMDTVSGHATDWQHGMYGALIEEGRVYGLGACDAKGAIATKPSISSIRRCLS